MELFHRPRTACSAIKPDGISCTSLPQCGQRTRSSVERRLSLGVLSDADVFARSIAAMIGVA